MSTRQALTVTAALGSGVAGGVFFGFSAFVMTALRRLPDHQGIAAMQSINRQAPTVAFMTLLFGTAALATALGVDAALHHDRDGALWRGAGSVAYLTAIGLTAGYHVPRNDRLAALDPMTSASADAWHGYLSQWTAGNHLRTAACLAAAAAYTCAVARGGSG